jgi:folate-binding protein YgfZ
MPSESTSSTAAAYDQLKNGVVIVTPGSRDTIRLEGNDRATFLHSFCTNDIKVLAAGDMCEAFFCNVQGKTIGHGYVLCRENDLIVDLPESQASRLLPHLDRYLIREDVQLHDESGQWQHVIVAGNDARQWVHRHLEACPERGRHVPFTVVGLTGIAMSRDWLSADAYTLMVQRTSSQAPSDVFEAFAAVGELHILEAGVELFEVLRVEQATPLFGRDISDDNLPQEVDRDAKAISFRKGCYLGQETVARLDALGHVNRKLCRLVFDTAELPVPGTALMQGEKQVGTITSAVHSPAYGAIGLGYVRRECFAAGTLLSSEHGHVRVADRFGSN